jgi:hypothetical protein
MINIYSYEKIRNRIINKEERPGKLLEEIYSSKNLTISEKKDLASLLETPKV